MQMLDTECNDQVSFIELCRELRKLVSIYFSARTTPNEKIVSNSHTDTLHASLKI